MWLLGKSQRAMGELSIGGVSRVNPNGWGSTDAANF